MAFGDIVKVTPSSKVVGDMAIFLVNHGMTMEQFARLPSGSHLTLPTSVIEMFMGSLGEPEGGWPKKLQKIILRGANRSAAAPARTCRRSTSAKPRAPSRKRSPAIPAHDEVLSYLMYPDVFVKFARNHQAWGDVDVLPTPVLSTACSRGAEITVELEPGKALASSSS
jgi:pyruvate carboxylase